MHFRNFRDFRDFQDFVVFVQFPCIPSHFMQNRSKSVFHLISCRIGSNLYSISFHAESVQICIPSHFVSNRSKSVFHLIACRIGPNRKRIFQKKKLFSLEFLSLADMFIYLFIFLFIVWFYLQTAFLSYFFFYIFNYCNMRHIMVNIQK